MVEMTEAGGISFEIFARLDLPLDSHLELMIAKGDLHCPIPFIGSES
jgi:hypothetical protein